MIWVMLITSIVTVSGTISSIILGWRSDRRMVRESELRIIQLERELEAVKKGEGKSKK
jgi:hypothetical protein